MPTAPLWRCCGPSLGRIEPVHPTVESLPLADLSFQIGPWPLPVDWFFTKPCPLCRQPLASPGLVTRLCFSCADALLLPNGGLEGSTPLPWWAVGYYMGAYRRMLLSLRQHPHQESIVALLKGVEPPSFPPHLSPLLVPVPSWKRQANPLPGLICRVGGRQWRWGTADLLERSRPALGQHHLNRAMRHENQRGAFTCPRRAKPKEARHQPVFLVDDILTTGATALNAAAALGQAGWRVHGLICLARTPRLRKTPQSSESPAVVI
jgi:predicted amidophosphoribosyltransferase